MFVLELTINRNSEYVVPEVANLTTYSKIKQNIEVVLKVDFLY